MKNRLLCTMAAGVVALSVTTATAQELSPAALLTNVEVKFLVNRAEPADHARLGDHFLALSAAYAADADQHAAMARAFTGNPNRRGGTEMGVHCKRLADLAKESASIARELATHHENLAAGLPSTAPNKSARFEQGAGAPAPSDKQLRGLAARARTPADHRALAEYYVGVASKYVREAEAHAAMAHAYRANANRRGSADPAVHCDRLVDLSREEAKEARAAAAQHEQLAGIPR